MISLESLARAGRLCHSFTAFDPDPDTCLTFMLEETCQIPSREDVFKQVWNMGMEKKSREKLLNTCNFGVFEITLVLDVLFTVNHYLGFILRVAVTEISLGEFKHVQLCRFVEVNSEWTMMAFNTATRFRTANDLTPSSAIFCI